MQHRLQRFVGRLGLFDELRRHDNAAPVHAAQDQAVNVNVQVGGRAKALNQSDFAAVGFVRRAAGSAEKAPTGSRGVLLHQAVQRGLLRAAALVVDRGAIRRPLELLHRGLHAGLAK